MRTWLLFGSLATGVLLFIYEWYCIRERYENAHGQESDRRPFSADDFIEINETTPKDIDRRLGKDRKLPGPEELCSICLDPIFRKNETKKYSIIALPQCGHWLHQRCAIRLLEYHPHCPVCRVSIDSSCLRGTQVVVLSSLDETAQIGENSNDTNTSHNLALVPQPSCSKSIRYKNE